MSEVTTASGNETVIDIKQAGLSCPTTSSPSDQDDLKQPKKMYCFNKLTLVPAIVLTLLAMLIVSLTVAIPVMKVSNLYL